MTKTPRWIAPLLKEAAACTTKMPWERGAKRAATLAARKANAEQDEIRLSA